MVLRGRGGVPVVQGALEPAEERLHRRAVAAVLEPLALSGADTLFLLLDVRHRATRRAGGARPRWYQRRCRIRLERDPFAARGPPLLLPAASVSAGRAQVCDETVPKVRR